MPPKLHTELRQDPAVERLARQSHAPIDDVAQLYGDEIAKLNVGAHLTGYIPIIAIRKVQELLRERGSARPVPA
jgi:hypothetical protein